MSIQTPRAPQTQAQAVGASEKSSLGVTTQHPFTLGRQTEQAADMTEEEAQQLREENARLKAEMQTGFEQKDSRIAELEGLLMAALLRIEELERGLSKDSHNRSKPPESSGLGRKLREKRKKSERRSGGQKGHPGQTLVSVAEPDRVIEHRLDSRQNCQYDLKAIEGEVKERRQLHDLPELRLEVEEHLAVGIRCPRCQTWTRGNFPKHLRAAAQYGPRLQALTVYLSQFQLLPMEQVCETLADLCDCQLSEGALVNWIEQAASQLEFTQERIKALVLQSDLLHADETGVRIKGILHWVHVAATPFLTLYNWHRKRGQEAIDAIGLLPNFAGRVMYDRGASYDQYPCAHSLCGAHLLRDCLFVAEQEKQPWGQRMFDHLLLLHQTTGQWRAKGASHLPKALHDELVAQYARHFGEWLCLPSGSSPSVSSPEKTGAAQTECF